MMQNQSGQPFENWGAAVQQTLLDYSDALLSRLQNAAANPESSALEIHEARKLIKRIRGLLQMVRPHLGEKRFKKLNGRLRLLSQELAPVRETAAMVELLEQWQLTSPDGQLPAAFDEAVHHFKEAQARASQTVTGRAEKVADLEEAVRDIRQRLEGLPLTGEPLATLLVGVEQVFREGKQRMKVATGKAGTAEAYHDWRKRVKNLLYQFEFMVAIHPTKLESLITEADQLADYLGEAHDLHELTVHFAAVHEAGLRRDPQLAQFIKQLNKRRKTLEKAARPLGTYLYDVAPAKVSRRLAKWERKARRRETGDVRPEGEHQTVATWSTREAAEALGKTTAEIRQMIYEGELQGEKVNGRWRITNNQ